MLQLKKSKILTRRIKMKCVEDVKPKGTVEGGEEENISEEEGDDVRD